MMNDEASLPLLLQFITHHSSLISLFKSLQKRAHQRMLRSQRHVTRLGHWHALIDEVVFQLHLGLVEDHAESTHQLSMQRILRCPDVEFVHQLGLPRVQLGLFGSRNLHLTRQ